MLFIFLGYHVSSLARLMQFMGLYPYMDLTGSSANVSSGYLGTDLKHAPST